ncbi:MAG: DUF1016 N-terminal domain-containing protein [Algoriphagus sp.]|nr:DUF1016 N-terminal domain-containing protein [Algoriphagus sp.]
MTKELESFPYQSLKTQIGELLKQGREQAGKVVNTILVQSYWQIGRQIVEFEQGGKEKAEYGSNLLDRLSKDLTLEFGKGFSRSNLTYMRRFFLEFPNREALSHKLSWSHYFEILKSEEPLEIGFYTKQCERENWSIEKLRLRECLHS